MSERTLVEIVCDGGKKIGLGNIRRSSALAVALQKENIDVHLTGLTEEALRLLPAISNNSVVPSVVVFDVAEGIEERIKRANRSGQVTIALDWFGDAVPQVNIAVYPHSEVKASKEKYIGFEYIMLRDEILKQQVIPHTGKSTHVFICLGGGDLLEQGVAAASFLADKGMQVTLVQGPLAKNNLENNNFTTLVNPPDFPKLLAACDWAVTNGGGCLFEALYFKKPTFVLPQTEWEMRIAVFVKNRNAVLGVGYENLQVYANNNLQTTIDHSKNMVDGHGTARIVQIIKRFV